MEFETLQKIIAEVLDVEEDEITMDTRLLEDLGADSLDAVEIIMGIEEEFDIEISTKVSMMNWELQFLRKSSKAKIWQPLAMCTN